MRDSVPRVAVVDYGVGNLFSVAQACMAAGLRPIVTSDPDVLRRSDGIILPGIGAFGDAMAALAGLNLVEPLRRVPAEGIPLVGICLGMQLLMDRSSEFGSHEGLGLVPGSVERLAPEAQGIKIPQVGWNGIHRPDRGSGDDAWAASPLHGLADGEPVYFVHSYIVIPARESVVLAESVYGGVRFCSALTADGIVGFQFHPERSGSAGLRIYRNLAAVFSAATSRK